jgi:selenocysteine lyase/cysteine desulfurase
MTLDVPLLRADTPSVANVVHFDNAGTAPPPRPVVDAVMGHLTRVTAIAAFGPSKWPISPLKDQRIRGRTAAQ